MAANKAGRQGQEQGMLNNIGGREDPAPEPAPVAARKPLGWMVYVGGALWVTVLCGAGFVAWLAIAGG